MSELILNYLTDSVKIQHPNRGGDMKSWGSRLNNPTWKRAFEFYNNSPNRPEEYKLGMGCSPCYVKVYNFVVANFDDFVNFLENEK